MKIHLLTLEDIAFHTLMPWLETNSDVEHFDEIMRAIDINRIKNHKIYFLHLIELQNNTGAVVTNNTLLEWKEFTNIRRNSKIERLTNQLFTFSQRDAKVNFYSRLIAHSVSAIMSSLQLQLTSTSSKPLKKQLVDKYVIRLKRIIEADIPWDDHSDTDLLILKLTKLGALMIYFLLAVGFRMFMNPYNELSHNDIMTAIAGISMADDDLKKIVTKVSKEYFNDVKKTSQPQPENKLKELRMKNVREDDHQLPDLSENQTIVDPGNNKKSDVSNKSITTHSVDNENYICSAEVIKWLNIDKTTLYRWRKREKNPIPHHQNEKGEKVRYKKSEINAWLKSSPEITDELEIRKYKTSQN